MSRERIEQLVDGELDGSLNDAEREELRALLDSDPEATALRDEWQALDARLQDATQLAPPAELRERILANARLPVQPKRRPLFRMPGFGPVLRYGFAAAAGVALTVMLYQLQPATTGSLSPADLVGTMSPASEVLDSFRFEDGAFAGALQLEETAGDLQLRIELRGNEPLSVMVDLAGSGLEFGAGMTSNVGLDSMDIDRKRLALRATGEHQLVFRIHRADGAAPAGKQEIAFEYSGAGERLRQGSLKPALQ